MQDELRTCFDEMTQLRTALARVSAEVADIKPDFEPLHRRLFRLMLLQLATLAVMVASLVAALAG